VAVLCGGLWAGGVRRETGLARLRSRWGERRAPLLARALPLSLALIHFTLSLVQEMDDTQWEREMEVLCPVVPAVSAWRERARR
jgi:hypothetical protein